MDETASEVSIGIRFPVDLVKALDSYRENLSRERGSRVKRSTVIRELVHSALATGGRR
jgi:hypothetical protein